MAKSAVVWGNFGMDYTEAREIADFLDLEHVVMYPTGSTSSLAGFPQQDVLVIVEDEPAPHVGLYFEVFHYRLVMAALSVHEIDRKIMQEDDGEIDTPCSTAYTAPGLLKKAADIMEERGRQYDQPRGERSMGKAVGALNTITGHKLTEADGWLLLQILKDVRDRQRAEPHIDSLEDCVAYSALKAEARIAGR